MTKYIPSPTSWVAEQVELYEGSGGTKGNTLRGMPVIIVTNKGRKTGAVRKTPLMRVLVEGNYVLVASKGGDPNHPYRYHNIKADPNVQVQDGTKIIQMIAREIKNPEEKEMLWKEAVSAYPPYQEYQQKTKRIIPVFLAEKLK